MSKINIQAFINGKIITVDKNFSINEAFLVEGEFISQVGSTEEILKNCQPHTEIIDLRGQVVVPGLIDCHAHLDREGLKSVFPSLGKVRSVKDIQNRLAELSKQYKPGEWIVTMPIGDAPTYFNVPEILEEKRFPTREELDAATPNNPVYIKPIWGFWRHSFPLVSIANSKALEIANINKATEAMSDLITIDRDQEGNPTGIFYENTMMPILELTTFNMIPGFSKENRVQGIKDACLAYHQYGTTSIFEEHGVVTELLSAYKEAEVEGLLTMRTGLVISPIWDPDSKKNFNQFLQRWLGWLGEPTIGSKYLKTTGLFVDINPTKDNALRAKALPYTGWSGFNYDTALSPDEAFELCLACAQNNIRVVAIWPNMIDILYRVHKQFSLKGRRWILGHISSLSSEDIEKIAEMELLVSTHTNRYIYKEGHLLKEKLGKDRENDISPVKSLLDKGVVVALATDNVPVSLFYPMWQVLKRQSLWTKEIIGEEQIISRENALCCATINGAKFAFEENLKGSLESGKYADFAILSNDPLTCPIDDIKEIKSLATYVGGKLVYES
jgi:predicted amidohydrolase YtcJ